MINMMKETSIIIEEKCPKIYSKELVEYLFYDFYNKNEYIRNALSISRNTASKYLYMLVDEGKKVGKETMFKNACFIPTYKELVIKNLN